VDADADIDEWPAAAGFGGRRDGLARSSFDDQGASPLQDDGPTAVVGDVGVRRVELREQLDRAG
jgi:hypothetical protein